jgi:MerR family transcriptional regulator, light-induced transcriptional regulator
MPTKTKPRPPADEPRYRSGAVARMVRMPVATLRIWERRYHVCRPALTASGQRLYSAAEVRRLGLLKQLTELGHAIGNLAALDWTQLQAVAHTHASTVAGPRATPPQRPWRLAVVGAALARRLQRASVRLALGRSMEVSGVYASVPQAAAALQHSPFDALLVHDARPTAQLRPPVLHDMPLALLYRFAAEPVCEQLAADNVALLREPQGDTALGQWLRSVCAAADVHPSPMPSEEAVRPRRWDDAQLTDFAGLSSTIACECPHHVAELLMQLSHFEAYSAECADSSQADAQLHAFLHGVASTSRALFEDALERVAVHEGLLIPS